MSPGPTNRALPLPLLAPAAHSSWAAYCEGTPWFCVCIWREAFPNTQERVNCRGLLSRPEFSTGIQDHNPECGFPLMFVWATHTSQPARNRCQYFTWVQKSHG